MAARGKNPMLAKIQARHEAEKRSLRLFTLQWAADMMCIAANIVFRWDDGLDVDNHGALGKMITDALKGWVIQDDNPKHLRRVTHEFWTEGRIGVEVKPWGK